MVELITRRALPTEWAELPATFMPMSVEERDMPRIVTEPDGRQHLRKRRTRVLLYVNDNQEPGVVPYDIGPATGEEHVSIPCGGAVEMAQVWELFEWHAEVRQRRAAEEELKKPERTARWLKLLEQEQHENDKLLTGATTVGPHHKVQREGSWISTQ